MRQRRKSVRSVFELYNPFTNSEIVDEQYIGDYETIFTLANGRRIIFDEIDHTILPIKPRENSSRLTEQEWRKEFRRRLRKKIAISKFDQLSLSEELGVSITTINNYANGRRIPPMQVATQMCRIFNCSMDDLTNFDYLL